jgi:hypothetical protein
MTKALTAVVALALLTARQPSALPPSLDRETIELRRGTPKRETRKGGSPEPSSGQAAAPRVDAAREKRLEWFREAKYGLFIHWGLYALPAGEWNGKRSPGLGEWVMLRSAVPVKEYERLASRFNPVKFDADAWVALAKDAGMKYIVIT